MVEEMKPDLSGYTPAQLREQAKQLEQGPYNDDLARVIALAKEVGDKHQKTTKTVLNACVARLPKSSR